jgi:hypothetical protein
MIRYKGTIEINYGIPLLMSPKEGDPVKLEDLYEWDKDYVLHEKEPGQLSGMENFLDQGLNDLIKGIGEQEDVVPVFYLNLNELIVKEVKVSVEYFGGSYCVKCSTELEPSQYITIEETPGNPVKITLGNAILNKIRKCVSNMSKSDLGTVMYKGTPLIVRMDCDNVEHAFNFYKPHNKE